jgi:hypothetical protein
VRNTLYYAGVEQQRASAVQYAQAAAALHVCTGGITAAVGRQRSQQAPVIGPAHCTELVSTAHTKVLSVRLYCALTGTAAQTWKEQQQ